MQFFFKFKYHFIFITYDVVLISLILTCSNMFSNVRKSRSKSPEKKKRSVTPEAKKLTHREGEITVKDEPLDKVGVSSVIRKQ